MPDCITRKRLKKKVLDRWENEGGKIRAEPTGAEECGQTCDSKGEGNQPSSLQGNSSVDATTIPTKNRKPNQR